MNAPVYASVPLPVQGMTCASCAGRVERVLSRLEGVASAEVNLAAERAEVRYDAQRVTERDLIAAIEGAGYSVPASGLRLQLEGMTCTSCARRIDTALRGQRGIAAVRIDVTQETAHVDFLPGVTTPGDIVATIEDAGYGATVAERSAAPPEASTWPLIAAITLTLPLVAPMVLWPFGVTWMLPGWAQLALATPVQFVLGARFYRAAFAALKARTGNMDLLVALGTSAAFGLSLVMLIQHWRTGGEAPHLYFEASAAVITLIMVGKALEKRAKQSTTAAVQSLLALRPQRARVVVGDDIVDRAVDELRTGDVVVVRPGERFPVDGRVVEGESEVDNALVTGESMPVARGPGDEVVGGAVNGAGQLRVVAERVGEDALLSRIIATVEGAQGTKGDIERLVDRVAAVFVPAVVAIALVTLAASLLWGLSTEASIIRAVAVLVIACPCALGLATPAARAVAMGVAARRGLVIRDGDVLERARHLHTVVFDKTGTLTEGKPRVEALADARGATTKPRALEDTDDPLREVLRLTARAQAGSEHPLGQAVVRAAAAMGLGTAPPDHFEALAGRGLRASVEGREVLVGASRLFTETGIPIPDVLVERAEAWAADGKTTMFVALDGEIAAALAVADTPRRSSKKAVARLKEMGVRVVMLTGDREVTARALATELGIDEVRAEVLPVDKANVVAELSKDGPVAMVGDGINDAPALTRAEVGIAMGGGTDVAMDSAGAILMRPDPGRVADLIALSRATQRKIQQNLFWAFIYNVLGLPLAAFGLLSPVVAGAAMALSSVSVVSNALLLRRFE